MALVKRCCACA